MNKHIMQFLMGYAIVGLVAIVFFEPTLKYYASLFSL